jgi:quinoprotein glucose dehydrogenase
MIGASGTLPNVQGLPIIKPPYGRITATDMTRRETVWQIPNGGILVTKTLLFAGEGYGGQPMLRTYDKKLGQIIWEATLPFGP